MTIHNPPTQEIVDLILKLHEAYPHDRDECEACAMRAKLISALREFTDTV